MDRDLTVGFGMPTIGLDKLSLCINADTLSECRSVKVVCNGVEHTYDPAKLKDAMIWLLKPYEIHENPSYECMEESEDAQRNCAGGAGDCVRHDVQKEVGDGISGGDCGVREVHHDRDLCDMGDCHVSEEALMTYDVLGNERHKAICELEERKPILGMTKTEILGDLGKAVTNDPSFDPSDIDHLNLMWSTLIHLLGGERDTQRGCAGGTDTCNHSHEQTPFVGYDVLGNERHKAICELKRLNIQGGMLTEKVFEGFVRCFDRSLRINNVGDMYSLRDRLIHLLGGDQIVRNAENYNLEDEPDAQNDENVDFCESNHATITDELHKWASTEVPYKYGHQLHAIADSIDEQFARICKQQEQVLQDTKIVMQDEIERTKIVMQNEIDRQKGKRDENAQVAEAAIYNSCMYLNLLRDAARDYKRLHDDYVELSHDHRELYDFAKSIEREVGENEFVTLFGVDYVPYSHVEYLGNTLSKVTSKWAKADAECRMYREMLNDAAKEYKALQESLGLVFGLWWMSATGGFK